MRRNDNTYNTQRLFAVLKNNDNNKKNFLVV